jgi:hypothetical protein
MLRLINAIANGLITFGGVAFYIMLFTAIGDGVKQIDQFSKTSYYIIKVSLALVVSGALLNVLMMSVPPFTEVVMNCGFGGLFMWAAAWHGKKFGVLKVRK